MLSSNPKPGANGAKTYPALDGLRGLAVLMILVHHFVMGYPAGGRVHAFLAHLTLFMWSGVDLFFVLSGFLITGILLGAKEGPHYFRTFYARRVLRIFPLYYGVLVLLLLVLPTFGIVAVPWGRGYYWGYLSNFEIARYGWPNLAVGHFWSLAIEEQFYLVWPLVIFFVRTSLLRIVLPSVVLLPIALRFVLSTNGTPTLPIYVWTFTHCDGLIMGSALAVLLQTGLPVVVRLRNRTAVLSGVAIALLFLASTLDLIPISFNTDPWGLTEKTFFFAALSLLFSWILFLCVGPANSVKQFFSLPLLQWFGKYSYGLYILHKPLMVAIGAVPIPNWLLDRFHQHPLLWDCVYIPLYFAVTIPVAYCSYHLFEKHFLKLKRYFTYRDNAAQILAREDLALAAGLTNSAS